MIGTVRKHQGWLWILIIIAIVVSFVIYFTPNVDLFGLRGRGDGGRSIPAELANAQQEVLIGYVLRGFTSFDRLPGIDIDGDNTNDISRVTFDARMRMAQLEQANRNGIQISDEALEKEIRNIQIFQDRAGEFSIKAYEQFVNRMLPNSGLTEADLHRFLRSQLAIKRLSDLQAIVGGMVSRESAEPLFRQQNEELTTETIHFATSNFTASVTNFTDLSNFYTNKGASYRIPDRVSVDYVVFAYSNFAARAELGIANITNIVDAVYQRDGTNSFKDTNGIVLAPEIAKSQIKTQLLNNAAQPTTKKAMIDFANALYSRPQTNAEGKPLLPTQILREAVTASGTNYPGLIVKRIEVAQTDTTNSLPPRIVARAFELNTNAPISEPLVAQDGLYLLAFDKKTLGFLPGFESLDAAKKETLKKDFVQERAQEVARKAGQAARDGIVSSLAKGQTFSNACATLKFTSVTNPLFSSTTRQLEGIDPRASLAEIQQAIESMLAENQRNQKTNKVAAFTETATGGFIVHLSRQQPPSAEKTAKELPAFIDRQRDFGKRIALFAWREAEEQKLQSIIRAELKANPSKD